MGCVTSSGATPEEKDSSKSIEKELRKDKVHQRKTIKLLLLGAGESGKSTIVKQMKVIHLDGFNPSELSSFIKPIHNNIVESVKALISACDKFDMRVADDLADIAEKFRTGSVAKLNLVDDDAERLKALWNDKQIQTVYSMRNKYQLPDSCEYYFQHITRICSTRFEPSTEDVLRCRARTTGIREVAMEIDGFTFQVIDVGGQRSERRKWFHCFEDVTALIFVAALNEYDMVLYEDSEVNRMDESLNLFSDVVNNKYFSNTSVILFLNKRDLFEEKLPRVDISVHFPEYTDGKDVEKGIKFIEKKFTDQNENEVKNIYVHTTTATDTKNIQFVFAAVRHTIITQGLAAQGF